MASYPGRNHTKRGEMIAKGVFGYCKDEQPEPNCPCDACINYWAAYDRRHDPYTRPAYGSGE